MPNSTYYEASLFIYDWVTKRNEDGMHFPLWGTCMGFESILAAQINSTVELRFDCNAHMPNNLTFVDVRPLNNMKLTQLYMFDILT